MYGSPPPPVPRIAAPTAMSSSSRLTDDAASRPPEIEIADRLHADPRRVAGQIRDRDVVDVDDAHGRRARRRQRRPCRLASAFASSSAASRVVPSSATTLSTSPPTCAIAAPIAFATAKCSGLTSSLAPGERVAEQDRAAADDDDRDGVGARLHAVDRLGDPLDRARAASRPGRAPATRAGSPISASRPRPRGPSPSASSPPKTSARGRQLVADALSGRPPSPLRRRASRRRSRARARRASGSSSARRRSRPRPTPRAGSRAGGCRRRTSCRRCRRRRSRRGPRGTRRRASSSSGRTRTSRPGSARVARRPSACRRSGSGRRARRSRARRARCERADDRARQLAQARVHDRRVLALEQADPADLVRERDRGVRQLGRDHLRRPRARASAFTGEKTDEIATVRDALRAAKSAATRAAARRVRAARSSARRTRGRRGRDGYVPPSASRRAARPADHRRQRLAWRGARAGSRAGAQPPRLDDRVREVRRPDHHRLHRPERDPRASTTEERSRDAARHVGCRRRLRPPSRSRPSTSTASVFVPPTSTPMRTRLAVSCARSLPWPTSVVVGTASWYIR